MSPQYEQSMTYTYPFPDMHGSAEEGQSLVVTHPPLKYYEQQIQ